MFQVYTSKYSKLYMWRSSAKSGASEKVWKLSFGHQQNPHRISSNVMQYWLPESQFWLWTTHLKSSGLQDNRTLVQLSLNFSIIESLLHPKFILYSKAINSFLPNFNLSLWKYKGFLYLLGWKLIFVKLLYSPVTFWEYYAKMCSVLNKSNQIEKM